MKDGRRHSWEVPEVRGDAKTPFTLDELMEEIAELYSNDVQYELKTLSQQIEPILIVFLGVLVLVLALGVFLPLWDLGRVTLKK